MVRLEFGDAACEIYPAIGGSLGLWTIGGQNMLRAASREAITTGTMLGMASFPLVPYSNRIARAQFSWSGESIVLRPNFAPEPHAIHGVGWQRPWTIDSQTTDLVVLGLKHDADDDWPWPFRAWQVIQLGPDTLTVKCGVTNLAAKPAPLGFGQHPYFDANGATLTFSADTVWLTDDDGLPTEAMAPRDHFDFVHTAPVAGRNIDHCYTGLSGAATIVWDNRHLALEIRSHPQLSAAVVYVPRAGDAFCFEPVPHLNNVLNLPHEKPTMPVIAPGDLFETKIIFAAFER